MARTKESARKQIHDHNVSSSSPSSSPSRSPSPPPRPSPPKSPEHVSDSVSDSPPSTQNLEKLAQTTSDFTIDDMQNPNVTVQTQNEINPDSSQIDPNSETVFDSQNEPIASEDLITPVSTIVVPSIALTPPVLSKPKRTKSVDRTRVRKSARILSGIGTGRKPIVDNTVYTIGHSDSENTLSEDPLIETAPAT
ncbi:hypothetical protein A2U01_0026643, partial [Trifolium medium]|nr:hypothetical protein [Trifolium medium]